MGVRRAHDRGIELIGELEIVEIAPAPAQQARVLAPQHRLPDGKFAHGSHHIHPLQGAGIEERAAL